jgi:alpha-L-fucosidase 2
MEMLVQSQQTAPGKPDTHIIELLPALPKAWPDGAVSGLCARGGFEVEMIWRGSELTSAIIHSKLGNPCVIRYGGREIALHLGPGKQIALDEKLHKITN